MNHYSRYLDVDTITFNDQISPGMYFIPDNIKNLKDDDLLTIKVLPQFAGRPEQISNEYYSTPYYAWVIVMYNAPIDLFGWPKSGSIIRIPKQTIVSDIINGRQK